MCPFDYSDEDGKAAEENTPEKAEPGEYAFKIDSVEFTRFKENSQGVRNNGWSLTLLVDAGGKRDKKVFDRLINTKKALWRFMTMAHSVGLRSKDKPAGGWQESQFVNLMGRAKFRVGDRGYLEVEEYIDAGEDAKPRSAPIHDNDHPNAPGSGYEPPPVDDRDVAF